MSELRRLAQQALLDRVGGKSLVGWHRSHYTNVDADQYLDLYRQQLLRGMQECLRIYLDTSYWVRLRDAQIGRGSNSAVALLARLRALVRSRRVICIGHASVFLELAKQSSESLRITAHLFDELTEGVVLAPARELRFFELVRFVAARTGQPAPSETSCWSKIARVLKTALPEQMPGPCTYFDRQVILKCAIDVAWQTRLEDLFAQLGWQTKESLNADIEADVIQKVEALKRAWLADGRTRKQVRTAEFSALLRDSVAAEFVDDLLELAKRTGRNLDRVKAEKLTHDLVQEAIRAFASNSLVSATSFL